VYDVGNGANASCNLKHAGKATYFSGSKGPTSQ